MNRKWIGCCLLAFACTTAVLISAQDDDATARAQVVALEKAWNQAYKTRDTTALAAILDIHWSWSKTTAPSKPNPSSSPA